MKQEYSPILMQGNGEDFITEAAQQVIQRGIIMCAQLLELANKYKVPGTLSIGIANDLQDQVVLQQIRDADIKNTRRSNYSDQGIRWKDNMVIDVMRLVYEQNHTPDYRSYNSNEHTANNNAYTSGQVAAAPNPYNPGDSSDKSDHDHDRDRRNNDRDRDRDRDRQNNSWRDTLRRENDDNDNIVCGQSVWNNPPPSCRQTLLMPAIRDVQDRYRLNMHQRLINIVRNHCGTKHVFGSEKEHPKAPDINSVTKYKGEDKMKSLETWVTDVSIYFAISNLSGPEKDVAHVYYSELLVDGKVRSFIRHHVFGLNRQKVNWTFEDVVTGLYDRFILASVTQDA